MSRLEGWFRVLGGAALAWSLVAALAALQAARVRPHDRMTEQDAEFQAFEFHLPPAGAISYLEPFNGLNDDGVRALLAAQYSLAPRVIVTTLDREFLIVTDGAERPGGDSRLEPFVPVVRLPSGHRLFRRFP